MGIENYLGIKWDYKPEGRGGFDDVFSHSQTDVDRYMIFCKQKYGDVVYLGRSYDRAKPRSEQVSYNFAVPVASYRDMEYNHENRKYEEVVKPAKPGTWGRESFTAYDPTA